MFPEGQFVPIPTPRRSHVELNSLGFKNAYDKIEFLDPAFETRLRESAAQGEWYPRFLRDYNYSGGNGQPLIVTDASGNIVARAGYIPKEQQLEKINRSIHNDNRFFNTNYPDAYIDD